jgi:hypothetical protein
MPSQQKSIVAHLCTLRVPPMRMLWQSLQMIRLSQTTPDRSELSQFIINQNLELLLINTDAKKLFLDA